MRPISNEFQTSQNFGEGATAGIVGNLWASRDTMEYYVGLYGDYQPFGHAGLDIACPVGTPVRAMSDGVVLYAGWTEDLPGFGPIRKWLLYWNFGGIVTVIQHEGWVSIIAHQSDNDAVKVGDRVREGQIIGLSGGTKTRGTYVDPHVHVEALVHMDYRTDVRNGTIYGRVDPRRFFNSISAQGTITEEDEMANLTEENLDAIADRVARKIHTEPDGKSYSLIWFLKSDRDKLAELSKGIINGVLRGPLTWFGFNGKKQTSGRTTTTLETAIAYQDALATELRTRQDETNARIDRLIAVLKREGTK